MNQVNREQEPMLTVKNLKTYFHTASGVVKAVDGVSFTLNQGETLGIVGESGSGKSVTASSIIRLLPPRIGKIEGGEVYFKGKDVLSMPPRELRRLRGREISMIFQDPMTSLDPVFKVGNQMVEMICSHQDVSNEEAWEIAVSALQKVGIPKAEERMTSYPYELSGGMCQRVIIAMAISSKPSLVIADEPTTALDVTVQAQVLDLLREMQQTSGTAILLITHDLGVAWEVCHQVMVMYAGHTVEFTNTQDLYERPLHPYTWGLLDSIPKLSDENKGILKTISGTTPDLRLTGTCCNYYNRCPYCINVCREKPPELLEVEKGHFVACHRQTLTDELKR